VELCTDVLRQRHISQANKVTEKINLFLLPPVGSLGR
jgi:hypothetical protein